MAALIPRKYICNNSKRTFVRNESGSDVIGPDMRLMKEPTFKLQNGTCPVCGSKDITSRNAIPVIDSILSIFNK